MRVRWLGWAGVEIEADGATVVIDPLAEPGAVFAALGDAAADGKLPLVVEAEAKGSAVAGLVSHLHRDHTDAGALARALSADAEVWGPVSMGGADLENLGLAQARAELDGAGIEPREVPAWSSSQVGPFTLTALPAVDGLGDPQVSWLVEAEGRRVLHLGDTVFHGYLWRIAQRHGPFDVVLVPINGAVVDFPHRQPPSPLSVVLDPDQAALVGEMLGASTVVPIHYDGFEMAPWYRPAADAKNRFLRAAAGRDYAARPLEPGESLQLGDSAGV
jgi:L-ascorbate metabolism protein UlaG (beta-lactamase superfamily)